MGMHQDRSADLVFQQAATVSGTATEPLRTRLFLSQPPDRLWSGGRRRTCGTGQGIGPRRPGRPGGAGAVVHAGEAAFPIHEAQPACERCRYALTGTAAAGQDGCPDSPDDQKRARSDHLRGR